MGTVSEDGSISNKGAPVAGPYKTDFVKYLTKDSTGHDMWHFIANDRGGGQGWGGNPAQFVKGPPGGVESRRRGQCGRRRGR